MRSVIALMCAAGALLAAEAKLGKPLTLKAQTPIADIATKSDALVGKTVQVKGKVSEVCQMMGCWMVLVDPATAASVRIKVKDGVIVFPKDSVGKMAIAEGKLTRTELTKDQAAEQAKHEAEENKKPFNPASISGPQTIYQIEGTGAVILE
jgi:hypothetical protein